jgi:hypothetical protein
MMLGLKMTGVLIRVSSVTYSRPQELLQEQERYEDDHQGMYSDIPELILSV